MSDLVKLLIILGGGFLVIIVGTILQKKHQKKKKEEEEAMYSQMGSFSSQTSESLSDTEEVAKKYILDYKSSYPRESLKQGLLQMNLSEDIVEEYLNKYL